MEGHDQPCYYCNEPCNSLAGNPDLWPIPLTHRDEPGVVKWHHIQCVTRRLIENQPMGQIEYLAVAQSRTGKIEDVALCNAYSLAKQYAADFAARAPQHAVISVYECKLVSAMSGKDGVITVGR